MFRRLEKKDFEIILEFLNENSGDKDSYTMNVSHSGNLSIFNGDCSQDLYLRPFPKDTLTIARMYLMNSRKRTGTKILNFCKDYAIRNNLKYIVMESVQTPEMMAFCKKHGFVPGGDCIEFDNVLVGNYTLELS